ncbi:MAG: alpha/beta hydrolase [Muribaculaceae bacterium]
MTEVLFIHGILGKPDYFDFLRGCVPTEGFHCTDILLEGHCDTPQAFGRASMKRWRWQVAEAVDRLRATGARIVMVAHSMGTLFSIDNGVKGKADALFLLNPPLSIRLTWQMPLTSIKVLTGKIDSPRTAAAQAAYSISDDHNPLHYIRWIPRYLELFAEIRRSRAIVPRLTVPTRVYLSARDEMVSSKSARRFPDSADIAITILSHSSHYYYPDADKSRIVNDFRQFLLEQAQQ